MLRFVLPALVWTLVVTILTLLPGKDLPEVQLVNFDKFAHFGVFFLLEWLYLRWKTWGPNLGLSVVSISLIVISYGGLIEILQGTLYTDRYADLFDFIANASGAFAALIVFRTYRKLKL